MKDFLSKLTPSLGSSSVLRIVNQSSDMILAIFVVIIFMMIIIPIPPEGLDIFIAINITVSLSLLMVSMYIPKATNISSFPSILLITTLFRLGIEISATRQILLYANAGEIIYGFGNLVVGGNFVVGGVIFLIITIVQFIVVTKGAERVAEVAARFTLDAMPGKQMSIDADMRSGMIDANQARELRLALAKESQLYGAMDGAMKFVKGDVIAGIVIAVINIVGGLIIGVAIHGMTAMQAAKIYTLLSIGGGLVSQVPSLLVSLTAGIITTRVSSDKPDANLGSDISSQILSHPKALFLSSGVLFILSLIPVFPWFVFLPLSLLIGGTGIKKMLDEKKARGVVRSADGSSMSIEGKDDHALVKGGTTQFALTLPVILEVGKFGSQLMKERKGAEFVELMVPKMRAALYADLGVRFPGVHVRTNAPNLGDDEYMIYLNEVPMEKGMLIEGKVLTNESAENLKRYNIPYTTFKSILNQNSYWVENRYLDILKKAGIKYWDSLDVMILHLSYFYKKNASEFLGIQEVRSVLEFIEKSFPDLAKEVTRLVPLQKLTEIFKRLIQEQISIKDLRTILEALSEWSQMEKDTVLLTEYVRSSLKRYISYKYSQGQTTLAVYMLDPEIEEIVRGAIKQTSGGTYLTLDPDSAQLILQAIRSVYVPPPPGGQQPVVLTSMDIRRFVRKLIEGEFPDLAVLSTHEIIPEIRIQPLGRIQLS